MKRRNVKEEREQAAREERAQLRADAISMVARGLGYLTTGRTEEALQIVGAAAATARQGLRSQARTLPPVDPCPIYELVIKHLRAGLWGQAAGAARLLYCAELETVRMHGADIVELIQGGYYGAALQRARIALDVRRALTRPAEVQHA